MAEKGDVTIKIPRQLYEKLQVIIAGTGFHSVTEFVVYVLRDLISTEAAAAAQKHQQKDEHPARLDGALTTQEVHLIRKRLRDLGYL
jgi:Arc/MetJ-type ribon-helix-helix transcriptional regulator